MYAEEDAAVEYEYFVIKGTCTVKVRGNTGGKNKKNNNEFKYEYVMSPLKLEKEKYSDDFMKKAFQDYLDRKHQLSKSAVGTLKKFDDKNEANKYARDLLKKRAKRTYMTESHVKRFFAKHGDKAGEKMKQEKARKEAAEKKKEESKSKNK